MTTIKVQKDVWNQITSYIAPDVPKLPEFICVTSGACKNLYNSSSLTQIWGPHTNYNGRIYYELYFQHVNGRKIYKDEKPKLYERIEAVAKYYDDGDEDEKGN